jgi:hypothetical protein
MPGHIEQLCVDEPVDAFLSLGHVDIEQAGAGPRREIECVQQPKPPEQLLCQEIQPVIAGREARPHRQRAMSQFVQPAPLVDQPVHQPVDPPVRPGGQPCRGDPQGERQVAAQLGELVRERGLPGKTCRPDDPFQQLDGMAGVEDVETHLPHSVKPGQYATARHHDPAAA